MRIAQTTRSRSRIRSCVVKGPGELTGDSFLLRVFGCDGRSSQAGQGPPASLDGWTHVSTMGIRPRGWGNIGKSRYGDMERLTAFGKALADPTRVRILRILRQAEACVCELTDALEVSQSTLSTHLQVLRAARMVATRKRGNWIVYSLAEGLRAAVEEAFEHFPPCGERIERDRERFARRVQMRVNECCVLGFGVLDGELQGASK